MLGFIVTLLAVYAALNAYVFWRIWTAFPHMGSAAVGVVAWMAAMLVAPMWVRAMDRRRRRRLASVGATVCFSWTVIVFWLCVMGFAVDAWNAGVRGVALAVPGARAVLVAPRPALLVAAGLIVAAYGWGLLEAANVRVREVTASAGRLPADMATLKLVQISDLHLGVHTGRRRLARLVELIERLGPDVLVSTGDMVDSPYHSVAAMSALLARVRPRFGKYAVLGNHDFYAGLRDSIAFHEAAGFRVLRGESVDVGRALRIAGVDDPTARLLGSAETTDEARALPAERDGLFAVLLKHQPDVLRASAGRFDLQLSGHTHGGQVFPWNWLVRLRYRFVSGLHRPGGGSLLYVSRGAGTWGPPIRVLAPPEVTVVTLVAETPAARRAGTQT